MKPRPKLNLVPARLLTGLLLFCLFFTNSAKAQRQAADFVIRTSGNGSVKPNADINLDGQIPEGSGLVAWNGKICTHNDSGAARIFALDSTDGSILKTYDLPRVKNRDWEDMSQDANYLYVGDLGNNSGARDRLNIYRIHKNTLVNNEIVMDTISFVWPQLLEKGKLQKTNFDCEAMALIGDSIFLFTKEWQKRRCSRIFKIPSRPGAYTADYVATIKTRLLVTGASYCESNRRLVLCGYSLSLTPRLLVFTVPQSANLKDLSKGINIRVRKRLRQTEGVTTFNGTDYYLVSEATDLLLWTNKPKLYKLTIP